MHSFFVRVFVFTITLLIAQTHAFAQRDDIVFDDFERDTFDGWKITGNAFGTGPAHGTLPNQMQVDGFEGNGLVSSFHGGDGSIGNMTSKSFRIERNHVAFLIGGGAYPNQTCIRLRIGDRIVRETAGPNRNSGGTERLAWNGWDVSEFQGRDAAIEIIDDHVGGWGHISIDQIIQSDKPRGPQKVERTLELANRYLQIPVSRSAPLIKLEIFSGQQKVRQYDIQLALDQVDFFAPIDMDGIKGKVRFSTTSILRDDMQKRLSRVVTSDEYLPSNLSKPKEIRPVFHFASRTGWLNDPNGLVYHDGVWHLYYQHNPVGWDWGNMHWGHATSKDLVRWTEGGDVFRPWVQLVGAAFSGSAIIDHRNSSGWGSKDKPAMVVALTDTDAGESIAYSLDGEKWKLLESNPAIRHQGRDPRLLWHEPTQRWIIAVYDEADRSQNISFYSSPDFKDWKFESRIDGYFECPDLFELPLTTDSGKKRWVLYGADGKYALGDFDGHAFKPEHEGKRQLWYGNFYAAQSYSNAPEGRRVQIGWGQGIEFPGQRFNQQMCVPVELTLHQTEQGPRMKAWPVRELDKHLKRVDGIATQWNAKPGDVATTSAIPLKHRAVDIRLKCNWKTDEELQIRLRGETIKISADRSEMMVGDLKVPMHKGASEFKIRLLVDAASVEIFVDDGAKAVSRKLALSDELITMDLIHKSNTSISDFECYSIEP